MDQYSLRILLLMSQLLFLRQTLPLTLNLLRLVSPLLTNNLRNLRIRKPRMLGHDVCLIMLAVQNESVPGSRDFRIRLTDANLHGGVPRVNTRMRGRCDLFVFARRALPGDSGGW